jgi:hypothetical protein
MSGNRSSSSTREALADASAGVAGSLVAMLTFYLIDLIKTNLQASTQQKQKQQVQQQQVQEWTAYSFYRFLGSFFCRLHYKTAHIVASSFTYFFIYSFIKSRHEHYCHSCCMTPHKHSHSHAYSYQPLTAMRLLLSVLAGMINVTFTFPLDVLAARSQTKATSNNTIHKSTANGSTASTAITTPITTPTTTTRKRTNTNSNSKCNDDVIKGKRCISVYLHSY